MLSVSEAVKWLNSIKEKYIHGGDDGYDECRREALAMGAGALESSEPKMLSKDKVYGYYHDVLFLELKGERFIYAVFEDVNDKVWLCDNDENDHRGVFISYDHVIIVDDEDYNRKWRCWNMMPSVGQRKAAPWEKGEKK